MEGLKTHFQTERGIVKAVDGISLAVSPGGTLAIVGESGSGKSITGLSIMRLVAEPPGRIVSGRIRLKTSDQGVVDMTGADEATLEQIRGDDVAMIFQEPMTALNPVYRIGDQIVEAVRRHRDVNQAAAMSLAVDMLERVGIPDPALRAKSFPHELSGGMRQRAIIAMALALDPRLVIADEPTTALDVTIQAQILDLLKKLQMTSDPPLGMIFITHNLGIVAEIADRVMVVYAGQTVEEGSVHDVFATPRHPYTRGLLDSVPKPGSKTRLQAIAGTVPSPHERPKGCAFAARCNLARAACREKSPELVEVTAGHRSRCHFWREVA